MFHYVHNMVANFVHLLLGAWQMCGACIMNGWRDIEAFLLKTAACLSKTTLMRQCISKEAVLLLVCARVCVFMSSLINYPFSLCGLVCWTVSGNLWDVKYTLIYIGQPCYPEG